MNDQKILEEITKIRKGVGGFAFFTIVLLVLILIFK